MNNVHTVMNGDGSSDEDVLKQSAAATSLAAVAELQQDHLPRNKAPVDIVELIGKSHVVLLADDLPVRAERDKHNFLVGTLIIERQTDRVAVRADGVSSEFRVLQEALMHVTLDQLALFGGTGDCDECEQIGDALAYCVATEKDGTHVHWVLYRLHQQHRLCVSGDNSSMQSIKPAPDEVTAMRRSALGYGVFMSTLIGHHCALSLIFEYSARCSVRGGRVRGRMTDGEKIVGVMTQAVTSAADADAIVIAAYPARLFDDEGWPVQVPPDCIHPIYRYGCVERIFAYGSNLYMWVAEAHKRREKLFTFLSAEAKKRRLNSSFVEQPATESTPLPAASSSSGVETTAAAATTAAAFTPAPAVASVS